MESHKSIDSQLCANGCGFYGSAQNNNLCTNCFKEYEKATVAKSKEEPLNSSSSPPRSSPLAFANSMPRFSLSLNTNTTSDSNSFFGASSNTKQFSFSGDATTGDSSLTFKTPISSKTSVNNFSFGSSMCIKNRCNRCNKRVGLTGFECRCGNLFCGKHRYPEEHKCSFDFKAFGREVLLKQNPAAGYANKLQRII
ncbi:zinc finger A20 and AN1 domain-containing stress-associated protein 1 [Jatropha curcas]|uniref:zinc finger A20 and AN1 domain-containing stress-associated protein 1 n=1 Tax=Jatropha curcas TaxID=180498 RepID=UPI0005FABE3D|nr:zinc finger A20 and AN1 domain-containing stress-associated protein 1 [Jatropha curcas]